MVSDGHMRSDIIFLHAPSVYDFRKKPIFYGPVSDVIPSSPVFEMYPVGFMTISSHLEAAGFRTRIVNIAVQMLQSDSFDVERRIKGLDADVFAIDLHWMPHAHGAIEEIPSRFQGGVRRSDVLIFPPGADTASGDRHGHEG